MRHTLKESILQGPVHFYVGLGRSYLWRQLAPARGHHGAKLGNRWNARPTCRHRTQGNRGFLHFEIVSSGVSMSS
jgi:hypothetical protein